MLTLYSYPSLFGVAGNNGYGLNVYAFLKSVGWAKARQRRAHHDLAIPLRGGHASLCPPYSLQPAKTKTKHKETPWLF
jgi:hypothetical protein